MLHQIRTLCPTSTLRSLYFSIFHSHLSYGLVVWGNAGKADTKKIKSLQKKAIKAISEPKMFFDNNITHKFYDLNILNIDDQIQYQISSLMWDYNHDTLPSSLMDCFVRTSCIHNYKTRGALHGNLYHTKVNTIKYGINAFKYQGIHALNNFKKLDIYHNAKYKIKFLKDLKSYLMSKYII